MSTSNTAMPRLRVREVETVGAADAVTHVDELSEETLQRFYEVVESGPVTGLEDASLEPGEVIVFTEYYRVERA
ncbi:hypothetical protein [Natrinema sp. 1APR25-10V2]|uniref:hypothetical protein n=1 Tax=Natrinema sp. 1APR25-10V2 TaxID=2951081 RepID=UPI0028745CDE|nr:hypothetical protein [Natrinema sp. 1APR25-10V2]MDS0475191.1 hypothetical protein [Natrinema sp. 1APR25-10V2]